ncbi:MAG: DNA-directed RNA polymerase subunit alpha [Chloroflexi bacterium]|nr:MAG: DNA-directed RNA polymerase subunit alpha [Chloroflexota bacterium]TMG38103.1 MAG: DNA-directed RNA polymerase subunit alpha [Chloroflexota bacterium]
MFEIAQPQVKSVENTASYGKFEIEPLEPGFGTTLGNSLRRVLLSTLKGAAVTSVSIEGVAHEFSSIPYVKEDVTEVILNLKGLNLISYSDEPVRMTLDVTGPREVRAADIQAPSDVEVVNKDLYICTLDNRNGRLRMELTVERGKGYVPADRNKKEGQPIGVIPIDAIFSPVVKANFLIEKTRVGQETDWDKLILEVWTDGTIAPDQAISEAAKQFTTHLGLFTHFTDSIKAADVLPAKGNDLSSRLADVPIEDLDLSVRALNCLKANEITKVGQLVALREEDLLGLRNFGRKSLDEIKEKLVQRGFLTAEELTKVLV